MSETSLKNDTALDHNINKQYSVQQEVNDLCEILEIEENKYLKYSIILETLKKLVDEDVDLNTSLKRKVKNILLSSQCSQTAVIDNELRYQNASTIFGTGETSEELSFSERNSLMELLERKLNEQIVNFDLNVSHIGTRDQYSTFQLLEHDQANVDLYMKLKTEEKLYVENLLKKSELLEKLKSLRLKDVPHTIDSKCEECESQYKINHLKSELLNQKIRVESFSENSLSMKAYKDFISDLKLQCKDCQREIDELKNLKEKYKVVSCKQFDEILKSYLHYKASNEKKKRLYECLKS